MPGVVNWLAIEAQYRGGSATIAEIASSHGISESYVRGQAKKRNWVRDAEATKRDLVRSAMAGVVTTEAEEDVRDMRKGLVCARAALDIVAETLGSHGQIVQYETPTGEEKTKINKVDARDLKTLSECIKINIETIRRIRGLDEVSSFGAGESGLQWTVKIVRPETPAIDITDTIDG